MLDFYIQLNTILVMSKLTIFSTISFLLMISSVFAADDGSNTSLYAVPILGLFVTSMVVVIVWLMYKDQFVVE